ncbi:MAG: YciI family protein [Bryobacteraceae bacterium]
MRFMVMVKASKDSEQEGALPDPQGVADMNKFTDELIEAGVMLAYEGLHSSSKGARVHFSGKNRAVIDGPFAETKELVAGFMLWQVKSLGEAIEWVKRMPNCDAGESEVEIRQVFEPEDFAYAFSEEDIKQEKQIRAQLADRAAKK